MLETIFHTTECKSEKRATAVAEAFAALKDEFKDLKRQLKKIVKESGADMASLLTLTSEEPLALKASSVEVQQFFTIQGVCKGYHLPGEAEHPWEWGSHWIPILTEGAAIGPDFVRGLQIASSLRGDAKLMLAGKLGGDRATAVAAVGQLIGLATTVDLSGNNLTDDECAKLCAPLEGNGKLSALTLLSNKLTAAGAAAIKGAASKAVGKPTVSIQAFGEDGSPIDGVLESAAAAAPEKKATPAATPAKEAPQVRTIARASDSSCRWSSREPAHPIFSSDSSPFLSLSPLLLLCLPPTAGPGESAGRAYARG